MELQVGRIYNSKALEYVRASEDDFVNLVRLVSDFKAECDGLLFSEEDLIACHQNPGHPVSHLRSSLFNKDSCVLLAKESGSLIGFLKFDRGLTSKSRHRGSFTMAIKKSHWGFGIGTGLLRKLEEWASGEGIVRLELCVLETNNRAIKLYEREGYKFEGQKLYAALVNGKYVGGYWMSKILLDSSTSKEDSRK